MNKTGQDLIGLMMYHEVNLIYHSTQWLENKKPFWTFVNVIS